MRRLEGLVAINTGGSNDIGTSMVRKFLTEGGYMYIVDVDKEAGNKVCQNLHSHALFSECDVTVERHAEGVIDRLVEEKGQVDVVLNNASMLHPHGLAITHVQLDSWERVMVVNVTGSMLGMKHVTGVMMPCGRGCILLNESVLGLIKMDYASYSYVASKHVVVGLIKSGAMELGKVGIHVNAVSSYEIVMRMIEEWLDEVSNGMFPKEVLKDGVGSCATFTRKRLIVDDVENDFMFLAYDKAAYSNRHNLLVEGGYYFHGRDIVGFKGLSSLNT